MNDQEPTQNCRKKKKKKRKERENKSLIDKGRVMHVIFCVLDSQHAVRIVTHVEHKVKGFKFLEDT